MTRRSAFQSFIGSTDMTEHRRDVHMEQNLHSSGVHVPMHAAALQQAFCCTAVHAPVHAHQPERPESISCLNEGHDAVYWAQKDTPPPLTPSDRKPQQTRSCVRSCAPTSTRESEHRQSFRFMNTDTTKL